MTKQQLIQLKYHYRYQITQAERAIAAADNAYIEKHPTHEKYPIGSELKIDHIGKEKEVRIQSYTVTDNGRLIPVFETIEGKAVFIEHSTIIDFLKKKK